MATGSYGISGRAHTQVMQEVLLTHLRGDGVNVSHRELESWVNDMRTLISAVELARDAASAEATIQRHRERKVHAHTHTHTHTLEQ